MKISSNSIIRKTVNNLFIGDIFIHNDEIYVVLPFDKEVVCLNFKTHDKNNIDKSEDIIFIAKDESLMKLISDDATAFIAEAKKILREKEDRKKCSDGPASHEIIAKKCNSSSSTINSEPRYDTTERDEAMHRWRAEQADIYGTSENRERSNAYWRQQHTPPSY